MCAAKSTRMWKASTPPIRGSWPTPARWTTSATIAGANSALYMIGQSVGSGGHATIGFTVLNSELEKSKKTLEAIVKELGATLRETAKVSKVSVVGAGMRKLSGVAEKMFQAI